jgi:hypothetical protein
MYNGQIDIVRIGNSDTSMMRIEICDDNSCNRFLEIEISPESLMKALAGLSGQPMKFEIRNLDTIGKNKIKELVQVVLDTKTIQDFGLTTNTRIKQYLEIIKTKQKLVEPEWELSTYIGSQKSVINNGDGTITLNLTKTKFIDIL